MRTTPRPDVRYSVLETHGWLTTNPWGDTPAGVSAHVYDWLADRIVAIYRSEDRWGPGAVARWGHKGKVLGVDEAIRRAQARCDELNAGLR